MRTAIASAGKVCQQTIHDVRVRGEEVNGIDVRVWGAGVEDGFDI